MANGQFFSGLVRLYHATFGRDSDMAGVGHWASQLARGEMVFIDVVEEFMASDEFKARYPDGLSNEEFVVLLYENVFHREPDEEGFTHWVQVLEEGNLRSQVLVEFSESDEFIETSEDEFADERAEAEQAELDALAEIESEDDDSDDDDSDDDDSEDDDDSDDDDSLDEGLDGDEVSEAEYEALVSNLYEAAFNRDGDEHGIGFWVSQLAQNKTDLSGMAEAFMASDEFSEIYGDDLGDDDFIEALYHNVLERDGDVEGHAFWFGQLVSGLARSDVLAAFANSIENTQDDSGDGEIVVVGDSGVDGAVI